MKFRHLFSLVAILSFLLIHRAEAQTTNSWTVGSGKWEAAPNWSAGVPKSSNAANLITNAGTTVTIDAVTVASNSINGCLTVSNLTVQGFGGLDTLQLTNSGTITPLEILNGLTIGTNAMLFITNGVIRVDSLSGGSFSVDGATARQNGFIIATNGTTRIGHNFSTLFTMVFGSMQLRDVILGDSTEGVGMMSLIGGSTLLSSSLTVGGGPGGTGMLWMTGAQVTVTNGSTFIGSGASGQIAVSNGTWLARDVTLGNAANSQGTLTIAGGNSTLTSTMKIGNGSNGSVWVTGGQLTVTNDVLYLGYNSPGVCQMAVSNGTAVIGEFDLGEFVGSEGTFTIAGGSTTITVGLFIGVSEGGTRGTVWMTGGQLFTHNASINVGNLGTGQMTLSNGLLQGSSVTVGDGGDSDGTLTVAGGTLTTGFFAAGETDGATGTVWMTGGQLTSTAFTFIGGDGMGQMSMSNGTWQSVNSFLGEGPGGEGTLNVAGGTVNETFRMSIGTPDCTGTGRVIIDGGSLFITNSGGTALLDVESGTFTLSSGTVVVDQIVMTNACAHFVRTGGTLIYNSAVLNPNADADGDGIPNGYEQAHGLDPLNPVDANQDNDHDGFSNLQEYLAGTDPNNNTSIFKITSIVRTNNDIRITWMMGPGKTNALQWTAATSNGFYQTNGYANLFIVTNTVGTVTNYLDIGGATNKPARYYRMRLVP